MPIFSRFGADFFTVYADFSRFVRDINGEKKNISLSMSFFTVSPFTVCPLSNEWERRAKRSKKQGNSLRRKKQGNPKSKERKIRVGKGGFAKSELILDGLLLTLYTAISFPNSSCTVLSLDGS